MKAEQFEKYINLSKAIDSTYSDTCLINGKNYIKLFVQKESGHEIVYRLDTPIKEMTTVKSIKYEFFTESEMKALIVKQRFSQNQKSPDIAEGAS